MKGQKLNSNANTGGNNEPAGANKQGTNTTNLTFDDFLKNGKNQAEFDRRVQKAINTAQQNWKEKHDQEKLEVEKLQNKLIKKQKDYEDIQKKLNARDLKDEAIKIATDLETSFDVEFLNLFKFEDMTSEDLKEKTKALKAIQDRIIEKAINQWTKEKPPYNPETSGINKILEEVSK